MIRSLSLTILSNLEIFALKDERELTELDEAVEALTAAIEWQDDTIVRTSTSADVRESRLKLARERNSALQKHMKNLNGVAAEMLLTKCFERVSNGAYFLLSASISLNSFQVV